MFFYQFDDVESAFGWTAVSAASDPLQPQALSDMPDELKLHLPELQAAFAESTQQASRDRLAAAAERRQRVRRQWLDSDHL